MLSQKTIIFFSCFFSLFLSEAQIRINEVSPSVQNGRKQWIELFVASGNISDHKVLVRYKTSQTDSGFYVFALSGNANGYFVLGNNNGNSIWQSTSLSKKISWDGTELPFSNLESNTVLTDVGTNHIFLLNGNKIVDALVTGISPAVTPIQSSQLEMNSWSNFNVRNGIGLDGLAVDFKLFQLTNLNTINQVSGNNTFSFIYGNNQCSTSSPWVITATDTREKINAGSTPPSFDYWETEYRISSTFTRGPSDFYVIPNNTIPVGSPTYDYTNATPTKLYFKYSLNRSTLTANTNNPIFRLFYDKGTSVDLPNRVLEPTDPEVSLNITSSLEVPNTVYINVPITSDMLYIDNGGLKKMRPLFPVLESSNACFKTQSILLASTLDLLPISLLSFSIFNTSTGIMLNWSTASEENSSGFDIERADDTPDSFGTIGFTQTKADNGMSQSLLRYAYQDKNVVTGKKYYYRLKLIDKAGIFSYSEVKPISPSEFIKGSSVFPNPSNGSVSIKVNSSGRYAVYIYDYAGREIKKLDCVDDSTDKVEGLRPGFYTIKFIDATTGSQSLKRLIVN